MIFRWVVYLLRMLLWGLFWPLRRLGKAPDHVFIELKPDMPLVEPPRPSRLRRLMGARHPLSAWRLKDRLEKLAQRSEVKGAFVLLRPGGFGAAQTEAIYNALRAFRESGREVVLWTKSLDLQRLAIASAATKVVLAPGGSVGPLGMHRDLLYFGDAVSALGLKLDVVHSGPHKSAYDRFVNTEPAPEVRDMMKWLFDDIYGAAVALIAKGRGVPESDVHGWIDEGLVTDERALKLGLVDAIAGEAATIRTLTKTGKKAPRLVPLDGVERVLRRAPQPPGRAGIAVLRVEGAIVDGVTRRPPLGMPRGGLATRWTLHPLRRRDPHRSGPPAVDVQAGQSGRPLHRLPRRQRRGQ